MTDLATLQTLYQQIGLKERIYYEAKSRGSNGSDIIQCVFMPEGMDWLLNAIQVAMDGFEEHGDSERVLYLQIRFAAWQLRSRGKCGTLVFAKHDFTSAEFCTLPLDHDFSHNDFQPLTRRFFSS